MLLGVGWNGGGHQLYKPSYLETRLKSVKDVFKDNLTDPNVHKMLEKPAAKHVIPVLSQRALGATNYTKY